MFSLDGGGMTGTKSISNININNYNLNSNMASSNNANNFANNMNSLKAGSSFKSPLLGINSNMKI